MYVTNSDERLLLLDDICIYKVLVSRRRVHHGPIRQYEKLECHNNTSHQRERWAQLVSAPSHTIPGEGGEENRQQCGHLNQEASDHPNNYADYVLVVHV